MYTHEEVLKYTDEFQFELYLSFIIIVIILIAMNVIFNVFDKKHKQFLKSKKQ